MQESDDDPAQNNWQAPESVEQPSSAPRSDLESADDADAAEQSASVDVTEATLEKKQTKALISESAQNPNDEDSAEHFDVEDEGSQQQQE